MTREEHIELLERQLKRLQQNFRKMAQDSEEADMILDWILEIRRKIEVFKSKK